MDHVDELNQEINKYVNYQRQVNRISQNKQQYLYRRQQENQAREERGEAPLPEEDLSKLFKTPPIPPRLDGLLHAGQMKNYCTEIDKLASQSFGKLFLADALQANPSNS